MAKPDTDDGWIKYAHELDAALAVADFGKYERIVLREVFAQLFGPALRRQARLSPTEIARAVGTNKGNISRAIRNLAAGGVLVPAAALRHTFVKDYQRWAGDVGGKRFDADELEYIRKAPQRALSYKHVSVVSPDYPVVSRDYPPGSLSRQRKVVSPDNERLSHETTPLHGDKDSRVRETGEGRQPSYQDQGVRTHADRPGGARSQPARPPEDLARVEEAIGLLSGTLDTEPLSVRLGANRNTPGLMPVDGWRFVVAARRMLSGEVPAAKRSNWGYFLGIARNATPAELDPTPAAAKLSPSHAKARRQAEAAERVRAKWAKEGKI